MPSGGSGGTGFISLTEALNDQNGSFVIEDLDNGSLVAGFRATFKLRMGGGSGNPADGFGFNWATDVANGTFGEAENGSGTGITVGWDIYDNGGGEAPAIEVKAGGVLVQSKKVAKTDIMTGDTFADVVIEYRDGKLSVDYKGQSVFKDLVLVFPPVTGARFGLGARTGGENANQWVDDLNIQTFAPTAPAIAGIRPNGKGFAVTLQDAPNAAVDSSSVKASFDGVAVNGQVTKSGEKTTIVYTSPELLAIGSAHNIVLTYKYGAGATSVTTPALPVTIPSYSIIPASAAVPAGIVDTTKRGFVWRIHEVEDLGTALPTTNKRAEDQLAGLLGDNVADPNAIGIAESAATAANPPTAPIEFKITGVINLSRFEATTFGNIPNDQQMPGLPGINGGTQSAAAEVLAALEFPAPGIYTMIVNSDDGFKTTVAADPRSITATVLGVADVGRGATDTPFQFYVEAAGVYAFRTLWENGGGDANIEWLTQLPDGAKVLVNDTVSNPQAIKAYQLSPSKLPAFLRSVSPGANVTMLNRPKTIEADLADSATQVSASSVTLKLNGTTVPANASKSGSVTKVVYTVPGDLLPSTEYTAEISYTDSTGTHASSWKFKTGELSATTFVVEAEDFDYEGGKWNPLKGTPGKDVDVMPYYGGAYDGIDAIEGVDYLNNDAAGDGNIYRAELDANGENEVALYSNDNAAGGNGKGGMVSINSSDRGSYTTTVNYSMGWVGNTEWENYTRTFPTNAMGNWWKVYAALSYGGDAEGQLAGSLSKVTSGVGTTDQTLENFGTFSAPGSGTWGANNLVPLKSATGSDALVKLAGQNTVRMSHTSGDFNFLIFSAAPPPPPFVEAAPLDSSKRNEVVLDWTLKDTDSKVNASSVKVSFGSKDVTANAVATKTDTGATVHLDLSGTTYAAGEYSWKLTFSDTSSPAQTVTAEGTFVVNPYPTEGIFVIEAEDFNYSPDDVAGGKTNPQKGTAGLDVDVMPYLGGAYDGLSAVKGVDYNNADANDSDFYRSEKDANGENEVNIAVSNGNRYSNDRGVFTTDSNWRVGWVASGDWQNYTRTFPNGDFTVWGAFSRDGRGAGQMTGSIDLVTSDPSKPNQTVTPLGTFNAGASGGWGRNELVPMKDTAGSIKVVSMGGVQTIRINEINADCDYVVFVPAQQQPAGPNLTIRRDAAQLIVEWSGGGVVQTAPAINGPWTTVSTGTSPFSVAPNGKAQFIRVMR